MKTTLKSLLMALMLIAVLPAYAVISRASYNKGDLTTANTTATGVVQMGAIRSYAPCLGAGNKHCYNVKVPSNMKAVIKLTVTGGNSVNAALSFVVGDTGAKKIDFLVGLGNSRSRTYTSSGKFFVYADGVQKLQGKYFDSFHCQYSYRIDVTYHPVQYIVTFNATGGSASPASRKVNHGAAVGTLPVPTYAGFTFQGWYTAPSGGDKISSSRIVAADVTYYAQWKENPKPDLSPYRPNGWSSPLVVASAKDAMSSSTTSFTDTDTLYVNWAVLCSTVTVYAKHYTSLYVDGALEHRWVSSETLAAGSYVYSRNYSLGTLSAGTHTIKIVADSSGSVAESNEGNNSYSRTITVTRKPGSTAEVSVPFKMTSSVVQHKVKLVKELISGSYSDTQGIFFGQTTLSRGGRYTIAMPKFSDFAVTCADSRAVVTYGVDDTLKYCLIDTRGMSASSTTASLRIRGSVGSMATVYLVASDYMPIGSSAKPEELPASSMSGSFRYDTTRILRSGDYSFSLMAVSNMCYELVVSGRKDPEIDIAGNVHVVDSTSSDSFRRILFTCQDSGKVSMKVRSDETGTMSVMWRGVSMFNRFKLLLDANGGAVQVPWTRAAYGGRVGTLPEPERAGYLFEGWYSAREGGVLVTADTVMTVADDFTLYAHWKAIAAGSCEEVAIGFSFTDSVRTYKVPLVREWISENESYGQNGTLYCTATVERGRLYTIAMPIDSDFDVYGDDASIIVTDGEDDNLAYRLIDTRSMCCDSATVYLHIYGDVKAVETVYVVASDYMPLGSFRKPEELPCDGDFSYRVSRKLLNRAYQFVLQPEPYMIYEFRVSGQEGLSVYIDGPEGDEIVDILEQSGDGDCDSASLTFSCPAGDLLTLAVDADTTGSVTVEWIGHSDETMVRLLLDGNGGVAEKDSVAVKRGEPVGDLPDAMRDGFFFEGWYTARIGGVLVTEDTEANCESGFTLYAHWKPLLSGSCQQAPVSLTFTADVKNYNHSIIGEWMDESGGYSDDEGIIVCAATISRGGLYTIALPLNGPDFYVECESENVDVEYGCDDALCYCTVDTRNMAEDTIRLWLTVDGEIGDQATIYTVAADYMPLGSSGKPENLPASITTDDGYFYYDVTRYLRNGSYDFKLDAVPGVDYELCVSGRTGFRISCSGGSPEAVTVLNSSTSRNAASVLFRCTERCEVSISVDADESGPFSVGWSGVLECDDCYDFYE